MYRLFIPLALLSGCMVDGVQPRNGVANVSQPILQVVGELRFMRVQQDGQSLRAAFTITNPNSEAMSFSPTGSGDDSLLGFTLQSIGDRLIAARMISMDEMSSVIPPGETREFQTSWMIQRRGHWRLVINGLRVGDTLLSPQVILLPDKVPM